MWDESECDDKRNSTSDILASWIIIAVILLGIAAWSGLELLMPETSAPVVASRDVSAPDEIPLMLNAIAPAAGPESSAADTESDKPRR